MWCAWRGSTNRPRVHIGVTSGSTLKLVGVQETQCECVLHTSVHGYVVVGICCDVDDLGDAERGHCGAGTRRNKQDNVETSRGNEGQAGTSRDKEGQRGTSRDMEGQAETSMDKQGQRRTRRDKQGQRWTRRANEGQVGTARDNQGQTGTTRESSP